MIDHPVSLTPLDQALSQPPVDWVVLIALLTLAAVAAYLSTHRKET